VNEEIVTDSDSDNPEEYLGLSDLLTERGKRLIAKKGATIRWKMERVRVKADAKVRFLSRKVSHRISRVLKDCPDIGKSIEAFVQSRNIGADAWHLTGVLTFDGNTKLPQKVTYEKIQLPPSCMLPFLTW